MKKQYNIPFKALLLLLIYLFSNSPAILFHHHQLDFAAYLKASSCERNIYYGNDDENCTHKTHISNPAEKCWLCDNHSVSPHSFQACLTEYISNEITGKYLQLTPNYYFQIPSTFSNRGPPMVSIHIA